MWLYLGLSLASALASHLVFDVVDDGFTAVFARPVHLVYFAVGAVLFALACGELGRGTRTDRLRRLAMARAAMRRSGPSAVVATCILQTVTAGGTLLLEGAAFDGGRLALAVAAAVLVMLAGTLALRHVERRILRLVEALFVSPRAQRRTDRRNVADVFVYAAAARRYLLFAPNRPPPLLA
jgi:hypothetical protein